MSDLLDKQFTFSRLILGGELLQELDNLGLSVTFGDAYRDPRAFGQVGQSGAYGNRFSCHKSRLAIDLNLFDGRTMITSTEGHRELGEWWEKQHPSCCWGGRFEDGNHYSMEHEGRR